MVVNFNVEYRSEMITINGLESATLSLSDLHRKISENRTSLRDEYHCVQRLRILPISGGRSILIDDDLTLRSKVQEYIDVRMDTIPLELTFIPVEDSELPENYQVISD